MATYTPFSYTSRLNSTRILILGGTSGVGFAVASAALQFGASVIISSSTQSKLDRALERLRAQLPDSDSHRISGKTCDLGDASTVEKNLTDLLDFATAAASEKLNHIVYTAGDAIKIVPLAETTPETIVRSSQVRFHAAVILAKLVPKYVPLSPDSSLTLTGGTNTDRPFPGWSMPAAVGAAVEGLARGLAVDLKPLRVNVVSLGAVHTELFDSVTGGDKEREEAFVEGLRRQTLVGEVGRPEDVAEAYLYLMRDRFATGEVFKTNGGRMLV
ncbi:hypothetical protein B0T16DRAFT_338828 [Cercophora newfieldiana]|uniref:Uncharacterized protein n=1 Tax=Cercophora newfieldiana TaxID=92897 RepID=A0AA40CHG6_9PEZI|nr:hypothetical protein B0T16DRAFT_338828 [Cercophora newfieldiana]